MTILTVGLHRSGDASVVFSAGPTGSGVPDYLPAASIPQRNNRSSRAIDDAVDYLQAGSLVRFRSRQTERSRERRGGRVVEGTRLLIWRTG